MTGPTGTTGATGKSNASPSLALQRKMTIGFPKKTITVVGGKAKVLVKCSGSTAQRCVGTLTLKIGSARYSVAYSVRKGKKAVAKVPLGADAELLAGSPPPKVTAIARTEQTSGGATKTKRTLRLK